MVKLTAAALARHAGSRSILASSRLTADRRRRANTPSRADEISHFSLNLPPPFDVNAAGLASVVLGAADGFYAVEKVKPVLETFFDDSRPRERLYGVVPTLPALDGAREDDALLKDDARAAALAEGNIAHVSRRARTAHRDKVVHGLLGRELRDRRQHAKGVAREHDDVLRDPSRGDRLRVRDEVDRVR